MNLNVSFIDSNIILSNDFVMCVEIENKNYFYRLVDILNKYSLNEIMEDIFENKVKIKVFIDFFNIDFNEKKVINEINSIIQDNWNKNGKDNLVKYYNKLANLYKDIIKEIDLPLKIDEEFSFNNLIKLFNLRIHMKNGLLDNLMSLIDIQRELNIYDVIVFVNLKQYLSIEELKEFYKYAIYNSVTVLLIDSQHYNNNLKFERKVFIDENLDEFVI